MIMRVRVLCPLPRSVTRPLSLMRAISPDGTTERPWTITVSGDKRLVEANSPRTLSAAGARGNFTFNAKLCHGCG